MVNYDSYVCLLSINGKLRLVFLLSNYILFVSFQYLTLNVCQWLLVKLLIRRACQVSSIDYEVLPVKVNHYHAQYRGHHSNIMKCCIIFLVVVPLLTAGQTIKMISTEPDSPLPDKAGYAELAGSSLKDLAEFSVCGRIFPFSFLTAPDSPPVQAIFSVSQVHLLASHLTLPCNNKGEERGI